MSIKLQFRRRITSFTNEDGLGVEFAGPGGNLNAIIHEWLQEQIGN